MNKDNLLKWIIGDNTGVSSITMWTAIMDVDISNITPRYRFDIPYDSGDFSRCLNLYNECELTKDDLAKVSAMFPKWKGIIEKWDILTEMYNSNHPDFYAYLRVLTK